MQDRGSVRRTLSSSKEALLFYLRPPEFCSNRGPALPLNLESIYLGKQEYCRTLFQTFIMLDDTFEESHLGGGSSKPGYIHRLEENDASLVKLKLYDKPIGDEGAENIAQVLGKNSNLQELRLDKCIIGDEGAAALAQALANNSSVTRLNLTENLIGDDGAIALGLMLQHNTTLQKLYLSFNHIGAAGAAAMARALETNTALTTLDVGNNSIQSDGLVALSHALETNTTLGRIYLSQNKVSERGMKTLIRSMEYNSTVVMLSLQGNGLDKEQINELNQILAENKAGNRKQHVLQQKRNKEEYGIEGGLAAADLSVTSGGATTSWQSSGEGVA